MDMSQLSTSRHAVAVVGAACSGAEAAETFANAGVFTVVFDQNARPFGKIEDGLPRWHANQRSQEYVRIADKLKKPLVQYVPKTTVGRDVSFSDLHAWGFSAVVLACGAWRDRPLDAEGAAEAVGKGVIYQNPFIYWFNHHEEKSYDGPRYELTDGAIIVGGGLASIDCVKAVMLETVAAKLRERGETPDVVEMEHQGLDKVLADRKLTLADLGLKGCTMIYRRTAREMPLASFKDGADEASKQKTMDVREKLMANVMKKFLCQFRPNTLPKSVVMENGRVVGLRVVTSKSEGRKVVEVPGSETVLPTNLIVSSIGSIPEPIPGLPMKGEFYDFADWDIGVPRGVENTFGVGNVVTGQGNIAISRKHSKRVSDVVIARYLGVGDGPLNEAGGVMKAAESAGAAAAEAVQAQIARRPKVEPAALAAIASNVEKRQKAVGFAGDLDAYIKSVTPPDRV
jgi:NADPH-dependent glutamate synthase beta subunit-like oxidoreductase